MTELLTQSGLTIFFKIFFLCNYMIRKIDARNKKTYKKNQ